MWLTQEWKKRTYELELENICSAIKRELTPFN